MKATRTSIKMIKFKAFVYQKTGIYLAHKEELDYVTSEHFWKSFIKIVKHPENNMSPSAIQGLLIGIWQADCGFVRSYRRPSLKRLLRGKK